MNILISEFDPREIKPWLTEEDKEPFKELGFELKECLTPLDYYDMYKNGPSSCMTCSSVRYASQAKEGFHPQASFLYSPYVRGIFISRDSIVIWRSICHKITDKIAFVKGYGYFIRDDKPEYKKVFENKFPIRNSCLNIPPHYFPIRLKQVENKKYFPFPYFDWSVANWLFFKKGEEYFWGLNSIKVPDNSIRLTYIDGKDWRLYEFLEIK
ncbi:MAG: hypothetical protein L0Y77_10205 [Chlorobi bacterium]|nr:hypothetical protein [Chlorobiota bacterium]